jgi:hypothetical protein
MTNRAQSPTIRDEYRMVSDATRAEMERETRGAMGLVVWMAAAVLLVAGVIVWRATS